MTTLCFSQKQSGKLVYIRFSGDGVFMLINILRHTREKGLQIQYLTGLYRIHLNSYFEQLL